MRVLLISANVEKLPDPVAPLGLACLSSALKYQGHDVHCLDLCFEENIESAMEKSLSNFAPEVIGLSLRNVDNVSYPHTVSYLPFYRGLVERCRQLSRAPIFLGGSGFTLMPEAILRYLDADGGAGGEGEEAFPRALMAIAGDSTPPIHGLIRRGSGHPPRPAWIEDLDSLPPPDWSGLDLKQYFSRGGMGNLQTKRGCPFRCIYCTYPLIEGQNIRLRSPEKVAQDAEVLIRLGVANAFIVDNIFNCPESHAQEVCRTFIRKGIPLQWSCYAHPAHFSPALAANMRDAGCTGVEFGTDSGSPAVLANLGKDFTPRDIERASLCAGEAGLEVCHRLSRGAPGETDQTLQEKSALMGKVAPNMTWDNVLGYYINCPYDNSRRLVCAGPSGEEMIISNVPHQLYSYRPIPELAHHRTPIKNLYATGGAWPPKGCAASWQGYNCYKIMAEDYALRKPWEEKKRPY